MCALYGRALLSLRLLGTILSKEPQWSCFATAVAETCDSKCSCKTACIKTGMTANVERYGVVQGRPNEFVMLCFLMHNMQRFNNGK